MLIEQKIPLVETILGKFQGKIREDYQAYKNHVYRVLHFCFALHPCDSEEREKTIIAGCFHDLGIWTDDTIDYLPPSIVLAKKYLKKRHLEKWSAEIELIIDMHHKLSKYTDDTFPLVEWFRRADLVDVSLGKVKWGLPEEYIENVKTAFPNSGFHKRLLQLAGKWFLKHPFNPAPMMKW